MEPLRGVANGLGIICVAIILWGAYELPYLASYIHRNFGLVGTVRFPRTLYRGAWLVVEVVFILGRIRCASIPTDGPARWWASASAMSNALVLLSILPWFVGDRFPEIAKARWLFATLAIFSMATFFLFLRRLALQIDRPDYAKRAVQLLIVLGAWALMHYGMPYVELPILRWATTARGVAPWYHRLIILADGCRYFLLYMLIAKWFTLAGAMRSVIRGR